MASQYVASQSFSQNLSQPQTQAPSQMLPPTQTIPVSQPRSRYGPTTGAAPKAKWDERSTEMFLRVCVTEHSNGNRPGHHFNKTGWQNIVNRFNNSTGQSYTRKMLKNKWDLLKKEWGIWQKLVRNETGLGWDVSKGTVVSTADWWSRKLQVTPEAARFQNRGPLALHEQEILFGDCVANGAAAWTPSSGIMPQHMIDDMENGDNTQTEAHLGEEDDDIENIEDSQMDNDIEDDYHVPSDAPSQSTQTAPARRRARTFPPRSRVGKAKKTTTAQIVAKCLQSMVAKFDNLNPQSCPCKHNVNDHTIDTCLSILDGLEGVEEGDDVWMYATRLFLKPIVRELFVKMKTDRMRYLWLKNQMEMDSLKRNMPSTSSPSFSSRDPSCNNQNF